jgi:hypothetical protein
VTQSVGQQVIEDIGLYIPVGDPIGTIGEDGYLNSLFTC